MRNLIRHAPLLGFKHPNLDVAEATTVSGFRLPPARLLVLFAALLASCGGGGGGGSTDGTSNGDAVSQSTYLPLDANSRWIYTNTPGGAQTTVRVLGAQSANGQNGILVQDIDGASNSVSDSVYVQTSAGVFEYPTVGSDPLTKAVGALQLMRFPVSVGDSFIQVDKSIDSGLDFDGDGISDRVALHSVVTVVGFENISTPAGTFSNCLHQQTVASETISFSTNGENVTINVISDDWYAPAVGLVRSSATARSGTISDTSTQTLVAYGVGSRKSETVPPTVQTVTPASIGAGSVVAVSAAFSEAMDAVSLSSGAFTVVGSNNQAVAGTVQVDGTTARFTPTQPWASGSYTARISTAAQDLVGNALASERTWNFTVDAAGPGVLSTTPVDGTQNVGLASPIVLQFSEPLDPATVNSSSVRLSDLNNTIPTTVLASGATVTLTPSATLQRGITYRVTVTPSVTDSLGNRMSQEYSFHFQTDKGLFAYPVPLSTTLTTDAMAIGDINGDGINDVVLTTDITSSLSDLALFVMPGHADGSLGTATRTGTGWRWSCSHGSIAIGDVNGDGRNDVVIGRNACGVQVFLQTIDGNLVEGDFLNGNTSNSVRIADLNGDGRQDLVSVGVVGNIVNVWRQDATGHLVLQATPSYGVLGAQDIEVGDVNGDGRPDLLISLHNSKSLAVLLQQADGTFAAPYYLVTNSALGATGVAIGDLNGDGRNDVVVTTGGNSPTYIGVYYQAADGSLAAATPIATYDIPMAVRVADMNNDGRADVVVSHQGWVSVGVYLQQAAGTLAAEERFQAPYGNGNPNSMAVGDVNRDGRPDIVIAGELLLQNASASPAALRALSAPTGARAISATLRAASMSAAVTAYARMKALSGSRVR